MKKINSIFIIPVFFLAFLTAAAQTVKIDASKSNIAWIGKKVTGQHEGIIKFKDGYLVFKNNKVTGGQFTADMTSLSNTDQSGSSKAKLEGHLKSDDFFGIDNFPNSTLVFKTIGAKSENTYAVTADLTIKGITNPIKFDLIVHGKKATAALTVNRTKYDIKYGSGSYFDDLGDKTIYDEFELNVDLAF